MSSCTSAVARLVDVPVGRASRVHARRAVFRGRSRGSRPSMHREYDLESRVLERPRSVSRDSPSSLTPTLVSSHVTLPGSSAQAGPQYAEAFLNVLRNVTHCETVQYTLALLVETLAADKSYAALFHKAGGDPDAYGVFSRLLQRPEWFIQEKTLYCLTRVIDQRPVKDMGLTDGVDGEGASHAAQTTTALVQWLCGQLRTPSDAERSVPSAVSALSSLLTVREVRPLVARMGGVSLLAPLLRSCTGPHNIQELYEATLCMWLLTFCPPAVAAMARSGAVAGLMEVARSATKEKVVRVAVLALRNIAEGGAGGEGNASRFDDNEPSGSGAGGGSAMIADETALRKVVQNLKLRGFTDEELAGALSDLEDGVLVRQKEASSWECYQREVLSGSLEWSAAHTDEGFWRESASKLTDNNCRLLRMLVKLLEASQEPRTLAVACHDLGEFATHYPAGRFLVQDIGGKEHAMKLMVHPDGEVRKQALLCTQKLLVANWKFIGQGGPGPGGGGEGGALPVTA